MGGLLIGAGAKVPGARAQTLPPPPGSPPIPANAAPAGPTMPIAVVSNPEVFTLMGSILFGTYTRIASDIAEILRDRLPAGPRILPVVAGGGLQVLYDILRLGRFDGGILSSVVLDTVRRGNWLPDLTERLAYVTHLYFEETHILSSQIFPDVASLNGKVVNLGPVGGGTDVIARRLFEMLGVKPIYDNRPTMVALKDIPSGTVAAAVFVSGKPISLFRNFGVVGNLRFMPIKWNLDIRKKVQPLFRPSVLVHDDYPHFIPMGTQVETVSSAVFLMILAQVEGASRQRALSTLLAEFVNILITLQEGAEKGLYHPKWREVSVLERLPGFRRSPALAEWLSKESLPDND